LEHSYHTTLERFVVVEKLPHICRRRRHHLCSRNFFLGGWNKARRMIPDSPSLARPSKHPDRSMACDNNEVQSGQRFRRCYYAERLVRGSYDRPFYERRNERNKEGRAVVAHRNETHQAKPPVRSDPRLPHGPLWPMTTTTTTAAARRSVTAKGRTSSFVYFLPVRPLAVRQGSSMMLTQLRNNSVRLSDKNDDPELACAQLD
jgi:hypothetical protein